MNACSRDPLVVWKGQGALLDGYDRYTICRELGIQVPVIEMDFPNIDHASLWIVNNQLAQPGLSKNEIAGMEMLQYYLEEEIIWEGEWEIQGC